MIANPIGVFDSGVGGLTVLSALQKILPHEHFIYVGDTARVPYGEKTPLELRRYAHEILDWLEKQNIKLAVMACNTTASTVLKKVEGYYRFPILAPIEPTAHAVGGHKRRLGLMATTATVQSGSYKNAFETAHPETHVISVACPELVPLIEGRRVHEEGTRTLVARYLQTLLAHDIDGLIYGCTHYPHLASLIQEMLPPHVESIDPALHVAEEVRAVLEARGILNTPGQGRVDLYTTCLSDTFQAFAEACLMHPVDVQLLTF